MAQADWDGSTPHDQNSLSLMRLCACKGLIRQEPVRGRRWRQKGQTGQKCLTALKGMLLGPSWQLHLDHQHCWLRCDVTAMILFRTS